MTISHVERAVSAPPASTASRRRSRRAPGIDDGLMGVALLAGPANVIMELARPGVGYGVMESRVESGRADRHPIKRARTTFTYLAVASRGSDEQKKAYRRAVNKSHAQVYSTPDSPVRVQRLRQGSPALGGGLPLQGRGRHLPHLRRRDGRRDRRPALPRRHGAGHHAAGARGDVARRPGRRSTGTGRSRWTRCTSTTRCASTCTRSRCRGSAVCGCPDRSSGPPNGSTC